MTIQLNDLTITASISQQNGSTHYEITSVRDRADNEIHVTSALLLDQIEEAIEDELMIQRYERMMLDCEIPHLAHLYL